jgi:hypothetical protein
MNKKECEWCGECDGWVERDVMSGSLLCANCWEALRTAMRRAKVERTALRLVVVAAAVACLTGCSNVLGLDDFAYEAATTTTVDSSSPIEGSPTYLDPGLDSSVTDAADATAADATDACPPVTHSNGLGQTWTDCVPLGTYNAAQAMKACGADVDAGGGCYSIMRPCYSEGVASVVCSVPSNLTYCWTYAGPYTGYVSAAANGCPNGSDPTWN